MTISQAIIDVQETRKEVEKLHITFQSTGAINTTMYDILGVYLNGIDDTFCDVISELKRYEQIECEGSVEEARAELHRMNGEYERGAL